MDSTDLTIAVNHWWKPTSAGTLAPDAAPYHLRAILRTMAEEACAQLVADVVPFPLHGGAGCYGLGAVPLIDGAVKMAGEELEARALALLVLAVGRKLAPEEVLVNSPIERGSGGRREATDQQIEDGDGIDGVERYSGTVDEVEPALGLHDDVTRIFAALTPGALRRVLLAAAERFPRTLEALLLHALSPAAAELLTSKLERDDAALSADGRDAERVHLTWASTLFCL